MLHPSLPSRLMNDAVLVALLILATTGCPSRSDLPPDAPVRQPAPPATTAPLVPADEGTPPGPDAPTVQPAPVPIAPAATGRLEGKVVSVADGDTLTLLTGTADKHQVKIRLHGIDSPEGDQPFGQESGEALKDLVLNEMVQVTPVDQDRYGRTVGVVFLQGANVNHRLVEQGWAWHFVRYAPDDRELAAAEAEARREKRGLWAGDNPIPPWEWRARQRANGGQPPEEDRSVEVVPNGIEILALLPNPDGEDQGREQVVVGNRNATAMDIQGWKLRDRAGNICRLTGNVPASGRLTVTMTNPSMPLNNDGDEVLLIDQQGVVRSHVVYGEVSSGDWIEFGGKK